MNKKKNYFKKIDLLLISLETLNIYFTQNKNIAEFRAIRYNLKKNQLNKNNQLIKIIKYIYTIKLVIEKYLLHEIANEILKNYAISNKCNTINKYNKKFYNRYFTKASYYSKYKLLHNKYNIDTNNIAIINLYIISKLIKQKGIYILIKYLLN
uniref:Uncharacterized protein n=1 Tax=Symphyocladiella dendroidea TaxID=2506487 RepID=A0A1Z1M7B0_9FLOR|nr:hypothetical protein [Symphyocladiella dendroidea]ARW61977.1 hypothetical protein [Symphyocladiella dendroidea]